MFESGNAVSSCGFSRDEDGDRGAFHSFVYVLSDSNRRMQKWFEEVMGEQCAHRVLLPDGYGEIHVPTASFNVIYILSHLYMRM